MEYTNEETVTLSRQSYDFLTKQHSNYIESVKDIRESPEKAKLMFWSDTQNCYRICETETDAERIKILEGRIVSKGDELGKLIQKLSDRTKENSDLKDKNTSLKNKVERLAGALTLSLIILGCVIVYNIWT